VRSLVVRTNIVNGDTCRRSSRVSKKTTKERLRHVNTSHLKRLMAAYCVWQNIVARVRRDHKRPVLHHSSQARIVCSPATRVFAP
jgi:hypothetical protein